jgi:membrane protein DedA with SNARE-associated domain
VRTLGARIWLVVAALAPAVLVDAVLPTFPGETTLNAAATLASQDQLELGLVVLAGGAPPERRIEDATTA